MKGFKILAAIGLLCICTSQVQAGQAAPYIYSIKYLCGLQKIPAVNPPYEPVVKPGNYATSVNVHNYHANSIAVITRKSVVANGITGPFSTMELKPNQAIAIDCPRIIRAIPSGVPAFVEGFVEIISNVQLSVTAVYTSQGCKTAGTTTDCSTLGDVSLEVVPQQPFFEQIG